MNSINRRRFCRVITASGVLPAFGVGFSSPSQAVGIKNAYPSMIGGLQRYTTTYEDSLVDLARKYGLGYTEIVSANPGVDPWVPGKSKNILLPTAHILPDGPREGILINLADQRLYFFREDGRTVDSAPLGIGNTGWDTPKGRTNVVRKKKNPTWYVPQSVREDQPELPAIVRPGPDNPLGSYAVYLGWPGYLFHGTNKPFGVGRRVSHGCVRLYPEDISRLFPDIKIGTVVTVIDQPMKLARIGNQLMLEIHPNQEQSDEVEQTGKHTSAKPAEFEFRLVEAAGDANHRIDWEKAKKAARERRGIPVPILT